MVTILEAVALVLEKEEGVFVDYGDKMDIRQAGGTHRPAVTGDSRITPFGATLRHYKL